MSNTDKEDLYKFLEVVYKDNESLKNKLAWMPDGVVLETVGTRFFYIFKGQINKVLRENEELREQNKLLIGVLKNIKTHINKVDFDYLEK